MTSGGSSANRAELAAAADALGVAHLVEAEPSDRRSHLELAGAVLGRAEGLAIVFASPPSDPGCDPGGDPVEVIEDVAFRALGMRARTRLASRMFWSLWTARRLQHQVRRSLADLDTTPAGDSGRRCAGLAATAAILDGVNALLSAEVHRDAHDAPAAGACSTQARTHLLEALAILDSNDGSE